MPSSPMHLQALSRTRAGTVRRMDLWSLLCWTYQRQKAHLILKGAKGLFDWSASLAPELDITPQVHPDAAKVHAAVLESARIPGLEDDRLRMVFGGGVAESGALLIKAAVEGNCPEPSAMQPRLEPVRNRSAGGGDHVRDGFWVSVDPIDLKPFEEAALVNGRGTVRRSIRGIKDAYFLYAVDLGRIRHRRRRKLNLTDARGRRHQDGRDGHDSGFQVFSMYCPVEQWPSQGIVDLENELYREWYTAMQRVLAAMEGVEFETVELSGFNAPPPNDDTPSDWMRAAMASLEELRGQAGDDRVEADAQALWDADMAKREGEYRKWFDLPQDKRTEFRRRAANALRAGEQERLVSPKKEEDDGSP